jgi:hypothetical protein
MENREAIEWFKKRRNGSPMAGARKMFDTAIAALEFREKHADVAPVVHSRWIKTADGAECEKCGREAVYQIVNDHWEYEPFCPHCGAKMDRKREEKAD